MARTKAYDELCMDEYPQGTNMVVAVCAHTGYDMEDAMILNKSSVDRGLAHGSLLKTEVVDLTTYKHAPIHTDHSYPQFSACHTCLYCSSIGAQ